MYVPNSTHVACQERVPLMRLLGEMAPSLPLAAFVLSGECSCNHRYRNDVFPRGPILAS